MSDATYAPRIGSIAHRVITFLVLNPDEELTRTDIGTKFDTQPSNVDTQLGIAVARGILNRTRNSDMELVWSLGENTDFILQSGGDDEQSAPADIVKRSAAPVVAKPAVPEIDLDNTPVRKGMRLLSPEERRRLEFSDWFDKFDVGDSAEFDDVHVPTIRMETNRHKKAKQTKWKIAAVAKGRSGVERLA